MENNCGGNLKNRNKMKRNLTILEAPCNLGLIEPAPGKEPGVSKLPGWLKTHGLYKKLSAGEIIEVKSPPYSMDYDKAAGVRNADAIALYSKQLSFAITEVIQSGRFPFVVGGDCSILIGCTHALKTMGNYGLFYIDGHTDFVLPGSSLTKGAAGMDLAIVTGYGHDKLTNIDGLKPYISEELSLAFGNRELEAGYVSFIEKSSVGYFDLNRVRKVGIETVVENFLQMIKKKKADGFWIHFDVDVLDDAVMPCVDSRQPGGLNYGELKRVLQPLLFSGLATGLNLTILDPDLDPEAVYTKRFIDKISRIINP
jgi:arginase